MRFYRLLFVVSVLALSVCACSDHPEPVEVREDAATFRIAAFQDLGGTAAAEISAYDPATKRLFTVSNETTPRIDVLDLSAFPTINKLSSIDVARFGGVANSVSVHDGKLAIAIEANNKQENGSVVVLNTSTQALIKQIAVGALPDMVTFSPNGRFIVTANEGEPNTNYSVDPEGSVSIIDVTNNYSVKTLTFTGFTGSLSQLITGGFRIFGPKATVGQDVEPEYVAISADSRKAWVTLQENNGIAEVDLIAGSILRILPLGTKNYSLSENAIDPSDRDSKIQLGTWPIRSFFLPDAIAAFTVGSTEYYITADEGDARDYTGFGEEVRISSLNLDPTAFPNGSTLKQAANLGRLRVTNTIGDTDGDGDYDILYGFGGRGFSIYNSSTGQRVFEIGKALEEQVIAALKYDDDRSDDKGVEPEGVAVGVVNGKPIAFIGLERADAVAVYDVSNPQAPKFLQLILTGDAPEGVMFIPASQSPNGRSVLVVSCEGDGQVQLFQPNKL